jgi:hypothetical protein
MLVFLYDQHEYGDRRVGATYKYAFLRLLSVVLKERGVTVQTLHTVSLAQKRFHANKPRTV